MGNQHSCAGCSSLDEKGDCSRSIVPFRRTVRVPDCFMADPDSMAAKYYDGAKEGYEAINAAIAAMADSTFATEQPMFGALSAGVGKHVTDVSEENLHRLAGFLSGAANRIREALALLYQSQPETANQG